jgi:HNH endonuclease
MAKRHIPSQLKQFVIERGAGCCEYCHSQVKFSSQAFSVEHITPLSNNGETIKDNLALACQGCNNHKYTKTMGRNPVDGEMVQLYHPRRDQWKNHFTWNDDYTLIIGLTSIGRATVQTLNLNREGLVNLRRILFEIGEHPPSLE